MRALLPRVIRNANAELMALKPELETLAAALPRIRAKVLIVHGTADDLVPVANVAFMQARLSGARCVQTLLLQGGNHFLPWNSRSGGARGVAPARWSPRAEPTWHEASPRLWLQAALAGMAAPGVIALVLALTTLLLEDLAIAAGVALATQGLISWELSSGRRRRRHRRSAISACTHWAWRPRRVPWLRRRFVGERTAWAREQIVRRLPSAVLLARVIPGLRLATYTACGFVRVPLAAVHGLGAAGGAAVDARPVRAERGRRRGPGAATLGLPPALAVALPILVLAAGRAAVAPLRVSDAAAPTP